MICLFVASRIDLLLPEGGSGRVAVVVFEKLHPDGSLAIYRVIFKRHVCEDRARLRQPARGRFLAVFRALSCTPFCEKNGDKAYQDKDDKHFPALHCRKDGCIGRGWGICRCGWR